MEEMEYIKIPLSGKHGRGKCVLVDGDYDGEWFSTMKLWLNPITGYVQTKVNGKLVNFHTIVCKAKRPLTVDHIDRDKLNNRSCNLRAVTHQVNCQNRLVNGRVGVMTDEEKEQAKKRNYENNLERIKSPEYKEYKAAYDKARYAKDGDLIRKKARERYRLKTSA